MSDKAKTTWIIIGCVLAVALVAFLVWKMRKRDSNNGNNNELSTNKGENTPDVFPLKVGSRGNEVRTLQTLLNEHISKINGEFRPLPVKVDGIFGEETATACYLILGTESVTREQFAKL